MVDLFWREVWKALPPPSIEHTDTPEGILQSFRSVVDGQVTATDTFPIFNIVWSAYTLVTMDAGSSKMASGLEEEEFSWKHRLACLLVLESLCSMDEQKKNESPFFPILVQASLAALHSSMNNQDMDVSTGSAALEEKLSRDDAEQKLEHATILEFVESTVLEEMLGPEDFERVQQALRTDDISEEIKAIVDDSVNAWTSGYGAHVGKFVDPLLSFSSIFKDEAKRQNTEQRVAGTPDVLRVENLLCPTTLPSIEVPFSRPLPPPAFPLYGYEDDDYEAASPEEEAALLEFLHGELIWCTPSCHRLLLLPDDEQDKAASEQFHKVVRLMKEEAFQRPMAPNEWRQIVELSGKKDWDGEEDLGLTLIAESGLTPQNLAQLVEHNPLVAHECLLRILQSFSEEDRKQYLSSLVGMDTSLHSMEVVNRLAVAVHNHVPEETDGAKSEVAQKPVLETEYIHLFIGSCIESCSNVPDRHTQNRLVRLVCVFVQSLLRNQILHADDIFFEVQPFCVEFSRIREANALYRTLQHQS